MTPLPGSFYLPPSAREIPPDIAAVIGSDPDLAAAYHDMIRLGYEFPAPDDFPAAVNPDSAVLLMATDWGHVETDRGRLMSATVQSKPLERGILDATLTVEASGVVDQVTNPAVGLFLPALWLRLPDYQVFVPLERGPVCCPYDWRREVLAGFAVCVRHPDPTETRLLYAATPPMERSGITLPPRPAKVGRNDRCPCGSGLKWKKCHGA